MKSRAALSMLFAASLAAACAVAPRPPAAERPSVAVSVALAEATDIAASFEAGGIIRARTTATIASRIMAPVVDVRVRPGDRVRRGAMLVTLDGREIEANRARASAALVAAAEAVRAADADTRAVESGLLLARATHERITTLRAKRSATAQEVDQAVAALADADAHRAAAQARSAAANAARDAARAAVESADINASYAVLSAPFDGVISQRSADPGSMAMPGSPILTLEDSSSFRLEVQVDEARATLIRPSQEVEIRLDNAPLGGDDWVRGHVSEIEPVDAASHSFVVKIDMPGMAALRSGLFGRARFAGPPRHTLTVPASALVRRGQLTFAFTVDANGLAHLRPLSCGATHRDRVEVLAGLHGGETVVINPPAALSDGSRVTRGER